MKTQPLVVPLCMHVISSVIVYRLPSFIHNLENIKDIEYFDLYPAFCGTQTFQIRVLYMPMQTHIPRAQGD